jgi:hypothetical protein
MSGEPPKIWGDSQRPNWGLFPRNLFLPAVLIKLEKLAQANRTLPLIAGSRKPGVSYFPQIVFSTNVWRRVMQTKGALTSPFWLLALISVLLLPFSLFAQDAQPLLLRSPAISKTQIVFAYGGDIWIVARKGGDAIRLVTGPGLENGPIFSPDGKMVAYTGDYDGNQDVYVVPATGGDPKRLTYHPGTDVAVGWTPDSKRILFRSTRDSYSSRVEKLPFPFSHSPIFRCPCPFVPTLAT